MEKWSSPRTCPTPTTWAGEDSDSDSVSLSVCLSGLQWVNYFLLNGKLQDAAGADGGAAAADAEVGSSAERRASQLGHEEAAVLRGAGADPEHEGTFLFFSLSSGTQPLLRVTAQLCKNIYLHLLYHKAPDNGGSGDGC